MTPCHGFAVGANAHFNTMDVHRAVVAALHIVFASPDQLDRRAPKALRDHRSFTLHMRVRNRTPAKAAAGHLRVKCNLLRLESQSFRNCALIDSLEL